MSGAYSELKELVSLRFQARELAIFRQNHSRSLLAGSGYSPFKGRGVNFEEVRAYQPGDDIRSIDWRVTARRMKPHTKLFREERERPVLVLVDQSHSMFFGSQLNFKSVTAAEAGALLAWATLQHSDRIGGLIFDEQSLSEIRPKRSKKTLMHLLNKLEQHNKSLTAENMPHQQQDNYLSKALRHARRVAHPGTNVFVISDFHQLDEESFRHLSRLSRHCELMAIQVTDPLESELPRPGRYDITNGMHRKTIDTRSRDLRQKYRSQHHQFQTSLKDQLASIRVPLMELEAGQDTGSQLQAWFGSRVNRGRPA
ncbi:DUF58 domain-containing protein [Endozoicomonas numazuensis]|uniref:DUF58 domain-containing protein n=1 Tax=Endozoicomonas numazuensis TaxID=1137799 RepID=UPI000551550F|nr:DUF58 domain-containing protein [Endozoicomonas numazuensis]